MKVVFSRIGQQGMEPIMTFDDFPKETNRLLLMERDKFKLLSAFKDEDPIKTVPVPMVKYDTVEIFI